MIRDEYDYHLEDISKVVVKSQHKIKRRLSFIWYK